MQGQCLLISSLPGKALRKLVDITRLALSRCLIIIFTGKSVQISAQIDVDELNSFKLTQVLEKSGPMPSEARKIQRKQMTFQIKFGAKEEN